jgi:hypothetical protein
MTTTEQLQDASLALTDAELIEAGVREIHDALLSERLDSITMTDVARDLLPKLDAIRAWLVEQVQEVTL